MGRIDGPRKQVACVMSTFFHGWRRKIGVITLVVDCIFVLTVLRSRWVQDAVGMSITRSTYCDLRSFPGNIFFRIYRSHSYEHPFYMVSQALGDDSWQLPDDATVLLDAQIPYLLIFVTLVYLSGLLLLSKPRTGKVSTESPPKTEP